MHLIQKIIYIYQDIYKKHIKGPKKFFVPKFIDKLMHRFGDAELYDKQLSYRNSIISDEPGIQELMKIIDKEHKGLEQEIFNSKEYKKYTFTLEPFCELELIISSDWERFGGNSRESENKIIKADENGNITVNIPAFSGLLYLCRKGERQSKAAKIKKKNVRT